MKSIVVYCRWDDLQAQLNIHLQRLSQDSRYVVNMTQSVTTHSTNGAAFGYDWALVVLWHVEYPKQLHPIGVN